MRPNLSPRALVLWLMLLTPGIPEYMSGSSPITKLLTDPPGFVLQIVLNVGLYTTGVLLIREWAIRAGKGWPSILLFGVAYGIVEEGVAVHTFFQTHGGPVGILAVYGHYLGLNLVWAIGISTFHAFYSVAIPLLPSTCRSWSTLSPEYSYSGSPWLAFCMSPAATRNRTHTRTSPA